MSLCTDPLVNQLNKEGYNTLYPPRPNTAPGDVFAVNGKELQPYGPLPELFESTAAAPVASAPQPAPEIYKTIASKHELTFGLTILGALIKAASGTNLGLKAAYKDAKTFSYTYGNISTSSILPVTLDRFLTSGGLKPDLTMAAQLLDEDELCVITDIMTATSITVEAATSAGESIELEVPVIQQTVGGKVTASGEGRRSTKITYEGVTPLVFGVRAVQLEYKNGKFNRMAAVDTDLVVRAQPKTRGGRAKPVQYVRFASSVVRLKLG